MRNCAIALILIIHSFAVMEARGQFYNSFSSPRLLEQESSAIELKDGFVYGFTESNSEKKFHKNILLIKANASGKILWSKRYDAGARVSIKLVEMISTFNDDVLISGEIGGNNDPDIKRCVLKISKTGKLIWAKQYKLGNPLSFYSTALVQLQDSSFVLTNETKEFNPSLMNISKNGDVLNAIKIANRKIEDVTSITAKGNTVDFVTGNSNVANFNFKTGKVSWQRQYKTSNQFTGLLSSRCRNGDIVYLAGRTYGGVLKGTSRIFRTDADGKLIWAKNLKATYDNTGSLFSIFDIVTQISIHEDINGNIVAFVMAESTSGLMVVFNAAGKYLYHRFFNTPRNFITETSSGRYLHTNTPFWGFPQNPLISYRSLSTLSKCDSTIVVTITNGTDSATALNPLTFETIHISPSEIPISVFNANIKTNVYCSLEPEGKNKPPTVSLSIPYNILKYTAPARIKLNATASDDRIITKVQFYNGSTLLHTEDDYPYGFLWTDVPIGSYTLLAKAFDDSGNVTTSNSIKILVVKENLEPFVSIVSPVDSTTYFAPASPRLIAAARDVNDKISKVEFYEGTTLLRTEYIYPYTYTWSDVQPGTYRITAKAYNVNGLTATSKVVTIKVINETIVSNKLIVNSKWGPNSSLSLKLGPNPANNILRVSIKGLQQGSKASISIMSALGVVVKTIDVNASNQVVQLDVSSLVRGIYIVKVTSGDRVMYKQFIKL
ncbi:Ig-like domain-containing protein [Segetibacter koreensis]|uniref:T9SS type A sorting domain-containing protein n=1 Tax=Segetibacter koreensis TaxID=398037 RepID=UPI00036B994E|nr:Ig-like domain-containing protein [Segetibacter koreensis]